METTKTLINETNYNKILKLITSEDQPSTHIGLSILEQSEIKNSKIYILLLLKHLKIEENKLIQNEYPKLYKLLFNDNGTHSVVLSYKFLYNLCKTNEEKTFLLDSFKNELTDFLKDYGFDFLTECELKIIKK